MSDTAAAIRAAKEVQADTLSPELYRMSTEFFSKAKREYKFKNFGAAKEFLEKSRDYAERAEYESLRDGAVRTDNGGVNPYNSINSGAVPPPPEPEPTPTPKTSYEYPAPESTSIFMLEEQQKQQQLQQMQQQQGAKPSPMPGDVAPPPPKAP